MGILVALVLAVGCASSSEGGGPRDAGGGALDTGRIGVDASPPDAGPLDAGLPPADAGRGLGTCAPCAADAECGPRAYCAMLTGGLEACVPACNPDLPMCPRGFRCLLDVAAGVPEPTCLPVGERCCVDEDGDEHGTGVGCRGADCDDAAPTIHPGAAEVCDGAGVDEDCNGSALVPLEEVCNEVDDDCDGFVDEGVARTYYADADGDGFGDPASTVTACTEPPGHTATGTDCDDTERRVHPGAVEECGCVLPSTDENCTGTIDEGCTCMCGATRSCGISAVGACRFGTQTCTDSWGSCMGAVLPTAEVCNGIDDDCNGATDDAITDCTDGICEAGVCRPGLGCAMGRRRGFLDEAAWPTVAACGATVSWTTASTSAGTVCDPAWHACTPAEVSALAGPAPTFMPADAFAWVAYTDATTTWWPQHSDTACGPPTVYANLRGTAACTPSGAYPEGWRLAVSAGSWGVSHQTAAGCIAHVAHRCGFPGGTIPELLAYTLCCR